MRALLVRVGADRSEAGGEWNGIGDPRTGGFVYLLILKIIIWCPSANSPHRGT